MKCLVGAGLSLFGCCWAISFCFANFCLAFFILVLVLLMFDIFVRGRKKHWHVVGILNMWYSVVYGGCSPKRQTMIWSYREWPRQDDGWPSLQHDTQTMTCNYFGWRIICWFEILFVHRQIKTLAYQLKYKLNKKEQELLFLCGVLFARQHDFSFLKINHHHRLKVIHTYRSDSWFTHTHKRTHTHILLLWQLSYIFPCIFILFFPSPVLLMCMWLTLLLAGL